MNSNSIIPLSLPEITPADIEAVTDTLVSGRLSRGPRQARFEEMVAERAGRRHGIAVSSGTAGLHLILLGLGIGPGDEVITTPFSFIASSNSILMVGAKPVFVDIDPRSLNMDPTKVEAAITPRTKAILGVEIFGNGTHMDRLAQIAGAHEIPLIEDSCEGLGGRHKNRPIGSFGRAAVFGFYHNKQITTGEGGMIVTDDDRLASFCRSVRNQGRPDSVAMSPATPADTTLGLDHFGGAFLTHERMGYNYRLSEIASALGVSQMSRLDRILESRRQVAGEYTRRLMSFSDLIIPNIETPQDFSWFVYTVRLGSDFGMAARDRVIAGMRRHDIGAANYFPCIHLQPFYKDLGYQPGTFPIAESISQRTIALPFFNRLDETQIELVCLTLKLMIDRERLLKE